MAQNKEQLEKLLRFIKLLVDEPGNEEFAANLRKMLGINPPGLNVDNKKIDEIEKYLGLDYRLDSASPIIDYSFVVDEYVRERLNSDNREMLRFRFGLRGHKEDFKEVCRFAVLQEEMLLNYFLTKKFSSFDQIQSYLYKQIESYYNRRLEKNTSAYKKINDEKERELNKINDYSAYEYIPLSTKQKAVSQDFGENRILEYARMVRNELSHRSTEQEIEDVIPDKLYLESLGVKISKSGYIDPLQFTNSASLSAKVLSDKRYWDFKYKIWKSKKNSDEVIAALQSFAGNVKVKI